MKYALLIVSFLLLLGSAAGAEVDAVVDSEINELLDIYKYLHAHPELSYQEKETAAFVADQLRELGFEVTEMVGDYGVESLTSYGLVAVMTNGEGPTVMVRTDLDALPVTETTGLPYASQVRVKSESGAETGVMHACGHDMHMSSFLGTARVLTQLKDRWSGTLVMIGQPAEERGAGALAMLNGGLYDRFPRPDYVIGLHVHEALAAGKVGVCSGFALASVDSVDVTIHGVGGHGAYPHKTIDPVVITAQTIMALQTIVSRSVSPLDSAVVTVGSIHGGTKHNIIPNDVHLQLTVRSYKQEVRSMVLDSIRRIARGTAEAAGVPAELLPEVKISELEYTPATYNAPELTARLAAVFGQVIGAENVVAVDPVMGGEDFSRYRLDDEIPSLIFWLGIQDPAKVEQAAREGKQLPPLHSSDLAPLPEPALRTGIRATSAAVLDLMQK